MSYDQSVNHSFNLMLTAPYQPISMKKIIYVLSALFQCTACLVYAKTDSFAMGQETQSRIFVNNRILATVNGKSISVIDVMKKMDLLFYKQFPQYTSSVMARFQFYQINWKHVMQELIDKELILADAEERKLPLTGGDVRQEMESLFGPNIIVNLDKVGLTFEEAWKMVEEDIKLRRMVYACANSKAIRRVTPRAVREAYEEYSKDNIRPEEWHYSVISIRDPDPIIGAETANSAHNLLIENVKWEELQEKITETAPIADSTKITVSELFRHGEKDLSPAYKEVLAALESNSYSKPIPQQSRTDKSTVFRIFYLKEKTPEGAVPFKEVEDELRDTLLGEAVNEETNAYLNKLRHHYHLHETHLKSLIPDNFEPFVLK